MPVKSATIFPLNNYTKPKSHEKEHDQVGQDIALLCSQLEAVEYKIDEIVVQIEKIQKEQRKQEKL